MLSVISPTVSLGSSSFSSSPTSDTDPETFFTVFSGVFFILPNAHSTASFVIIFLPGFVNTRKELPPSSIINKNISIFINIFNFFFFFLVLFLFSILFPASFELYSISSLTWLASEFRTSFKNSSSLFILIFFLYCSLQSTYQKITNSLASKPASNFYAFYTCIII